MSQICPIIVSFILIEVAEICKEKLARQCSIVFKRFLIVSFIAKIIIKEGGTKPSQ